MHAFISGVTLSDDLDLAAEKTQEGFFPDVIDPLKAPVELSVSLLLEKGAGFVSNIFLLFSGLTHVLSFVLRHFFGARGHLLALGDFGTFAFFRALLASNKVDEFLVVSVSLSFRGDLGVSAFFRPFRASAKLCIALPELFTSRTSQRCLDQDRGSFFASFSHL